MPKMNAYEFFSSNNYKWKKTHIIWTASVSIPMDSYRSCLPYITHHFWRFFRMPGLWSQSYRRFICWTGRHFVWSKHVMPEFQSGHHVIEDSESKLNGEYILWHSFWNLCVQNLSFKGDNICEESLSKCRSLSRRGDLYKFVNIELGQRCAMSVTLFDFNKTTMQFQCNVTYICRDWQLGTSFRNCYTSPNVV